MGAGQKKCAVARPIHLSNSHTKFGWISSNGLGKNSVTDRRTGGRTDGGDCNIKQLKVNVNAMALQGHAYYTLFLTNCLGPKLETNRSMIW